MLPLGVVPHARRPRWHDVLIVVAIGAILATGIWALWWDDVRAWLGHPVDAVPTEAAPTSGQT